MGVTDVELHHSASQLIQIHEKISFAGKLVPGLSSGDWDLRNKLELQSPPLSFIGVSTLARQSTHGVTLLVTYVLALLQPVDDACKRCRNRSNSLPRVEYTIHTIQ